MDSLFNQLVVSCAEMLPMHMPGHKRNTALAPYLKKLAADIDITEILGFDHLHAPGGILKEAMARAARVFQAENTFFLVNGSSLGMLAAIRAATRPGDAILMARNCHLSAYNAVVLNHLKPSYIYPEINEDYQINASLSVEAVAEAICQRRDAKVLVMTNPTYEGVLSDLKGIIDLAHREGLMVIVDEAHGAHLGLHPLFPSGAVKAGADIVVQSLHKTLPSLTQTALTHVRSAALAQEVQRQLSVFETTSPSFLLLASIDGCVRLLEEEGDALFSAWAQALDAFDKMAAKLQHLKVLGYGKQRGQPLAHVWGLEPSKVYISTLEAEMTGYELAGILRRSYHIEPEMIAPQGVLAMTGMGDTAATMTRLGEALLAIDEQLRAVSAPKASLTVPRARSAMPIQTAERAPYQLVPVAEAAGRIIAERLIVYPPGVPVLVPGEEISPRVVRYVQASMAADNTILHSRSEQADMIAVLRDA
ncbi:MAG: aminotransferase class I/II-fold pyridoxal phosphate-dependent enzyme [Christensenellales bacterium]